MLMAGVYELACDEEDEVTVFARELTVAKELVTLGRAGDWVPGLATLPEEECWLDESCELVIEVVE